MSDSKELVRSIVHGGINHTNLSDGYIRIDSAAMINLSDPSIIEAAFTAMNERAEELGIELIFSVTEEKTLHGVVTYIRWSIPDAG